MIVLGPSEQIFPPSLVRCQLHQAKLVASVQVTSSVSILSLHLFVSAFYLLHLYPTIFLFNFYLIISFVDRVFWLRNPFSIWLFCSLNLIPNNPTKPQFFGFVVWFSLVCLMAGWDIRSISCFLGISFRLVGYACFNLIFACI